MDEPKRYYWMRLRADFFEDDLIDYLEEQEHGAEFIVIYLKLALKSLKNEGLLYRIVGDKIVPYTDEKIANLLRFPLLIVTDALQLFVTIGLMKVTESGIWSFPQVQELIGSASANDNAQRQRKYRERKKVEEITKKAEENLLLVTKSNATSVTESNATSVTVRCNTPLRNSNERKRKSKSIEKEIDKGIRHAYGEYSNVFLGDDDLAKFKDEYPELWETYINEMSGWLAATGKSYKNYLAALRNWAKRDLGKHKKAPAQTMEQSLNELII